MKWVLFYDGDCAFCCGSVQLVAKLDRRRRIEFAPLRGQLSARLGFTEHADRESGTLILFREPDQRIYKRSGACIELAHALGGGWRLFTIFALVPRPLRDGIYRWVARHRHLLLRNKNACSLPDPALSSRMRE